MVTLEEITVIGAPIERCFDLARSVEVHLAGNVHCGESAVATAGITSGLVEAGQRVTWRAKHFALWHELTSEITARGIFRSMRHDHFFRALSGGSTEMTDVFRFAAPVPILGRLVEIALLRRSMQTLLRQRNAAIKQIAESSTWREAWGIRFGLPNPAWLIEAGAFLIRTESELVLKSRRVVPGRLLAAGFQFLFPEWPSAARDLVDRARQLPART